MRPPGLLPLLGPGYLGYRFSGSIFSLSSWSGLWHCPEEIRMISWMISMRFRLGHSHNLLARSRHKPESFAGFHPLAWCLHLRKIFCFKGPCLFTLLALGSSCSSSLDHSGFPSGSVSSREWQAKMMHAILKYTYDEECLLLAHPKYVLEL